MRICLSVSLANWNWNSAESFVFRDLRGLNAEFRFRGRNRGRANPILRADLGSHVMIDTMPLGVQRTARPPRRWRNWLFFPSAAEHGKLGWLGPGRYCGPIVWPSRDAAETGFAEFERVAGYWMRKHRVEYLGAYPEGQEP